MCCPSAGVEFRAGGENGAEAFGNASSPRRTRAPKRRPVGAGVRPTAGQWCGVSPTRGSVTPTSCFTRWSPVRARCGMTPPGSSRIHMVTSPVCRPAVKPESGKSEVSVDRQRNGGEPRRDGRTGDIEAYHLDVDMLERLHANDTFDDLVVEDIDLTQADLSNKEFTRCAFTNVHLPESVWTGARLEDCTFTTCDMTRMKVKKTGLRSVEFNCCRLTGTDWSDVAPNPDVTFTDCNLQYATFATINLTGTAFKSSRIAEANFFEARLVEATFGGCDLAGSRFEGCDLRDADFSEAQGVFFEPAKNRVKDARVSVATAVVLAQAVGLRVSGFDERRESVRSAGRRRKRR